MIKYEIKVTGGEEPFGAEAPDLERLFSYLAHMSRQPGATLKSEIALELEEEQKLLAPGVLRNLRVAALRWLEEVLIGPSVHQDYKRDKVEELVRFYTEEVKKR